MQQRRRHKFQSGSEWAAIMATLTTLIPTTGQRRFARTATTVTIHTRARLMGTTARATLSAAYLSVPARGITATTDAAITDGASMAAQDITDMAITGVATADAHTTVAPDMAAVIAATMAAATLEAVIVAATRAGAITVGKASTLAAGTAAAGISFLRGSGLRVRPGGFSIPPLTNPTDLAENAITHTSGNHGLPSSPANPPLM